MNLHTRHSDWPSPGNCARSGSVLVIVLWVALGLVTITLYFANTTSFALRAADHRLANAEAEQAIAGAMLYVSNLLVTSQYPGTLPDPLTYQREALPVGDATFWLLGRPDLPDTRGEPYFNLVDESSKLNLNTVTSDMLLWLPQMSQELAASIIDWRDPNSEPTPGGAEDETYQRLFPPYRCKNGPFESVQELRLVYGMDLPFLFGEDGNLNGVLDMNENDADQSFPLDNRDGRLDRGLLDYFTVYSKEPITRTNGAPRVNVAGTNRQELVSLLTEQFGSDKANEILTRAGMQSGGGGGGGGGGRGGAGGQGSGAGQTVQSVLEFYVRTGMTAAEFAQIEADLIASTNTTGLVNVNTASEAVLACIPGIGIEYAPALIAYRQNNWSTLAANPSVTWVSDVLGQTNVIEAGPFLTGHTYQLTADVAAVGHLGRGFQRVKLVFDTSEGAPRVIFRQDLTHLGWPLGRQIRNELTLAAQNRR